MKKLKGLLGSRCCKQCRTMVSSCKAIQICVCGESKKNARTKKTVPHASSLPWTCQRACVFFSLLGLQRRLLAIEFVRWVADDRSEQVFPVATRKRFIYWCFHLSCSFGFAGGTWSFHKVLEPFSAYFNWATEVASLWNKTNLSRPQPG